MLREQVLAEWKNYQVKVINFKKAIDFLTDKSALPSFPVGYKTARSNLDFWTSHDYCQKLDQSKHEMLAETPDNSPGVIWLLQMNYINSMNMFKELTHGWKEEIAHFGPDIEEVD